MRSQRNKGKSASQSPSADRVSEDTARPVETSPSPATNPTASPEVPWFLAGKVPTFTVATTSQEAWDESDRATYDLCARVREMRLPLAAGDVATVTSLCAATAKQAADVLSGNGEDTPEDDRVAQLTAGVAALDRAVVLTIHTLNTLRPESAPKARTLSANTVNELEELAVDLEGDALRNMEQDLAQSALEIRRFLREPSMGLLWLLAGAVARVIDANVEWAKSGHATAVAPSAVQSAAAANALHSVISDLCPKTVIA